MVQTAGVKEIQQAVRLLMKDAGMLEAWADRFERNGAADTSELAVMRAEAAERQEAACDLVDVLRAMERAELIGEPEGGTRKQGWR